MLCCERSGLYHTAPLYIIGSNNFEFVLKNPPLSELSIGT